MHGQDKQGGVGAPVPPLYITAFAVAKWPALADMLTAFFKNRLRVCSSMQERQLQMARCRALSSAEWGSAKAEQSPGAGAVLRG
jgi:hypothetical protein